MATGKIIYKDISELEQKQIIAGNEKLPISENEFITPEQIVAGVDAKADDLQQQINNKYEKPSDGIPNTDMSSRVRQSLGKADSAYQKPGAGIPKIDMASSVQMSLNMADSAYQKPGNGIPRTDLASGVQASLNKADSALQSEDLAPITGVIPAQASSENQLADKEFVNSSIATNAATFRGTFNSVAELEAYMGAKDNNDYAFVIGADSAGNTTYSRYKYDGTAWVFEYTLNNSSFTSAQWAAINSGISSEELADILTDVASKQDTISDLSTIRSGAALGATAAQPGDLPTVPTISTDIDADAASDAKTASPKAVADYVEDSVVGVSTPVPNDGTIVLTHRNGDTDTVDLNHVHPQYYSKAAESSQPVGGFAPDVVYVLGELGGSVTFALASAVSGNVNHYFWTFETGASAPTVTWPAGITWLDGSAPTPGASKHCEVSILGGVGVYMEA